jgi:penicillin amidase
MKVATTALRQWNYRMDADSPAGMIFHYALICLLEEVFGSKLGPLGEHYSGASRSPLFLINGVSVRMATRVLEMVTQNQESAWFVDVKTGRNRSRDEVLYAALAQATRRLRADLGDNVRRWEWGRAHQVRYVHPLGGLRLFRGLFNRGPFPVGGDLTTPNQTYSALRLPLPLVQVSASYRQVLDVGEWDACQAVTTTGQSGHPMSQQYADQMGMWLEGAYHPMPWTSSAMQTAAHYRAHLVPAERREGEEGFPA